MPITMSGNYSFIGDSGAKSPKGALKDQMGPASGGPPDAKCTSCNGANYGTTYEHALTPHRAIVGVERCECWHSDAMETLREPGSGDLFWYRNESCDLREG